MIVFLVLLKINTIRIRQMGIQILVNFFKLYITKKIIYHMIPPSLSLSLSTEFILPFSLKMRSSNVIGSQT